MIFIKQIPLVTFAIGLWATAGATDLTPSSDTYIRNSVPTTSFGSDTSMVANLSGTNVRMAIFSFDLSSVPPGTIASAKLQLQDVIGNASQSYQIWGLLDAHETFNESTLTWNTAGFLSGTTIDLTKAYGGAALGTFNNVQNSVNTLFNVTSGNFLNFLNASGDNDVTFVIVDTNSSAPGSGWATKEHTTALNPTLTLATAGSPTLASGNIVDDQPGGTVVQGSLVTYTVAFSKDMADTTVDSSDFGNAGTATFTTGSVTETSPGVFNVPVTATGSGSLRLKVNQGAILSDPFGNNVDTWTAILDDTTITVTLADVIDPTLHGITDDKSGGPVPVGTLVTYTVTFSEDMNGTTVDASDFGVTGTAGVTFGTVTETSAGVFTVPVTANSVGTMQLRINQGAILADLSGNDLDTAVAVPDDAVISVVEGFSPAGVKRLRVVFVAGQSNADGRATTSELPTNPVNLQLPQNDVDFFRRVENTIHPLTTLRPGLSETGGFGPAITCGRYLADELADGITTRVAIIKYANGGTNLHTQWAGGGNGTTTGDGSEYVRFQQTVTAGLAALASTYPNAVIELLGMVWLQGESDDGAQAVNYQTNLTNFIADVRQTYGADLRFVVIRLSNGQTAVGSLATIQAAQTAVAAADPLTGLVNSNDFGMKTDNLHFNGLGQQQNGEASAIQLLNLYPFLSPLQISAFGGGNLSLTVNNAFDGFVYTLRSSDTMQAGDWELEEVITAAGDTVNFTVTPSGPKRFYRVERNLAP